MSLERINIDNLGPLSPKRKIEEDDKSSFLFDSIKTFIYGSISSTVSEILDLFKKPSIEQVNPKILLSAIEEAVRRNERVIDIGNLTYKIDTSIRREIGSDRRNLIIEIWQDIETYIRVTLSYNDLMTNSAYSLRSNNCMPNKSLKRLNENLERIDKLLFSKNSLDSSNPSTT